jgi:flagellar hook-basal body complex protein FliE
MPSISSIPQIRDIPRMEPLSQAGETGGGNNSFRALLDQSVRDVSQLQDNANVSVDQFLSGEQEDPHTMMLSVQRASLAFDMFTQVRNKVISAYQEVMRMPE